jgi:hypothetical protein
MSGLRHDIVLLTQHMGRVDTFVFVNVQVIERSDFGTSTCTPASMVQRALRTRKGQEVCPTAERSQPLSLSSNPNAEYNEHAPALPRSFPTLQLFKYLLHDRASAPVAGGGPRFCQCAARAPGEPPRPVPLQAEHDCGSVVPGLDFARVRVERVPLRYGAVDDEARSQLCVRRGGRIANYLGGERGGG